MSPISPVPHKHELEIMFRGSLGNAMGHYIVYWNSSQS